MHEPALVSVEACRPSIATVAALHPAHYGTMLALSLLLLSTGCLVSAGLLVLVDLLVLSILPRSRLAQRGLAERAAAMARRRAADHLGTDERLKWQDLESLALRTRPVNARKIELDQLLTTYLNVALMLGHARGWVASVGPSLLASHDADPRRSPEIKTLGVEASRRSDGAVARLEQQLATTADLIRCLCEGAVAAHVDAVASLWAGEVDEASHALPVECAAADDERA